MVLTNDNGLHFLTTLANPFPNGVAEPVGAAAGLQTYLGQGFTYFNQNPKIPVTMRWEASLQRAVQGASCSRPTTSAARPTTSRSPATSTRCRGSI